MALYTISSTLQTSSSNLLQPVLVNLSARDTGYPLTIGAVYIGICFNTFLFGLTSYQFILYYFSGFDDPLWIKAVVASLLVIDVFHSCAMIHVPWVSLVENYNNPAILQGKPTWELVTTPILDSLAAGITQSFLIHRIFKLRRSRIICIIIALLTMASVSLGISVSVAGFSVSSLENAITIRYVIIPWNIAQALADLLISGILVHTFLRSKTGNRQTDWAIGKLLRKSIQTGIPAALVAVLSLLIYAICGTETNSMFAALTFPHGRIYTLTLMDTLLVRTTLREKMRRTDASQVLRNFQEELGDSQVSGGDSGSTGMHHVELGLVRLASATAYEESQERTPDDTIYKNPQIGFVR